MPADRVCVCVVVGVSPGSPRQRRAQRKVCGAPAIKEDGCSEPAGRVPVPFLRRRPARRPGGVGALSSESGVWWAGGSVHQQSPNLPPGSALAGCADGLLLSQEAAAASPGGSWFSLAQQGAKRCKSERFRAKKRRSWCVWLCPNSRRAEAAVAVCHRKRPL